jgi:hypothetical protein
MRASNLYDGVMSLSFHDALLVSVALSIPILIEHLLDNTMRNRPDNIYKTIRVLALSCPNLILLLTINKNNEALIQSIPCILCLQIIIYIYSHFSLMNGNSEVLWTPKCVSFFSLLFSVVVIIDCYRGYISDSYNLFLGETILFSIGSLVLFIQIFSALYNIYEKSWKNNKSLNHNDYCYLSIYNFSI